ncbi:MAG: hypothetical protein HYV63_10305 [Candidatus Schekmanbacteria bacterium]|nr:hypothetical protein [Candidatus Schekmanbacteria bacterium]
MRERFPDPSQAGPGSLVGRNGDGTWEREVVAAFELPARLAGGGPARRRARPWVKALVFAVSATIILAVSGLSGVILANNRQAAALEKEVLPVLESALAMLPPMAPPRGTRVFVRGIDCVGRVPVGIRRALGLAVVHAIHARHVPGATVELSDQRFAASAQAPPAPWMAVVVTVDSRVSPPTLEVLLEARFERGAEAEPPLRGVARSALASLSRPPGIADRLSDLLPAPLPLRQVP